jgi:hypothetical protein
LQLSHSRSLPARHPERNSMHDVDSANFYALVEQAELLEISLTDTPANPHARVLHRYPVSPAVRCYDIAKAGVLKLIEITKILQEMHHGQQHQEDMRPRVVVSSQEQPDTSAAQDPSAYSSATA